MFKLTALPCGHSCCQECLAKLLALQPNPKCPLCKKCIPGNDPLNINYILHDITSKLQVYCTNEGCHWTGTYDGTEHHANRCERVKVECQNNGCTDVIQGGDMASHLLECPKQEMRCMDCGESFTRESRDSHLAISCSYRRIYCPLGCEVTMPQWVTFDDLLVLSSH